MRITAYKNNLILYQKEMAQNKLITYLGWSEQQLLLRQHSFKNAN